MLGDRLCGPVVRVLGYRSGDPGWIPGTTKKKVEELLERKRSGSGLESREYSRRDSLTTRLSLSAKVDTNFADKRRHSVGVVRSRTQATVFSLIYNEIKRQSKFCVVWCVICIAE
jgi:hypothetical protein